MAANHKLYRSQRNCMLGGICGGLGEFFDIDPTVIRVIYILLSIFTAFMGILVYIILLFVIPKDPDCIDI